MHSFQKTKNSIFFSADTYGKQIVSKEYCNAHHDAGTCILPLCRYHIYCWVTLKSCFRYWTYCVSHINMKTVVSIDSSGITSMEILLSRVFNCLVISREQTKLFKEKEKWTKYPASLKRNS